MVIYLNITANSDPVNRAPWINTTVLNHALTDNSYTMPISLLDYDKGDKDGLSISLEGLPEGLSQVTCPSNYPPPNSTQYTGINTCISGKPKIIGKYPITISGKDNKGGEVKRIILLNVFNSSPIITTNYLIPKEANKQISFTIVGDDYNNDALNMSITLPNGLSVSSCTDTKTTLYQKRKICTVKGTITNPGNYRIDVTLTDSKETVSSTLHLLVTPSLAVTTNTFDEEQTPQSEPALEIEEALPSEIQE